MNEYKLKYHLMPTHGGWLNDPNGLCEYNGTYHIFYQYCKEVSGNGDKCWGHYTTKDFVHYNDLGIVLYPDTKFDKDGVYSGSCLVEDGMHFFYTGNVKLPGNHDYIRSGRLSNTMHVYSKDGITFSEKEVVLDNSNYPLDLTNHIRDPKVFKKDDEYYMVLGARNNKDEGCILVYKSKDLKNWKYCNRITSKEKFGYMWECPDLFELEEDTFLITCPQGIDRIGYLYENDNQNGYFKINENEATDYQTLDYGYDFYAPQSFVDEKGRRILIAWLGLPDSIPTHPTVKDGWQMCLSLPRVLKNVNHEIYQYPIQEILDSEINKQHVMISNETTSFKNKASHIHACIENEFNIQINNLSFQYHNKLFSLVFNNDQTNRTQRDIEIDSIKELDIFLDTSSIEIFINKGQRVMTSRYYDEFDNLNITSVSELEIEYGEMQSFEITNN